MAKPRMLFITNLLPYPLDSGGKIRSYHTLLVLKSLYDIDLLCFVDKKEDLEHQAHLESLGISVSCVAKSLQFRSRDFYSLKQVFMSLFTVHPYVIYKYSDPRMSALVREKLAGGNYEKIYVDHLALYLYAVENALPASKVVLDQHNVESEIIRRACECEKNPLRKAFLGLEYRKLFEFERKACVAAGLVLAITAEDKRKITRMTGGKGRCETAPFYIRSAQARNEYGASREKIILFIGGMSWLPNEDGVRWFYENVFCKYRLKESGWRFWIVGGSPGPKITALASDDAVTVTGYVKDTSPYLHKAMLAVVPLRIGGGMRIKIFELFSYGLPVVSTAIGAEGIPVSPEGNILIADDAEATAKAIERLGREPALRQRLSAGAFEFFRRYSDFDEAVRNYAEILK